MKNIFGIILAGICTILFWFLAPIVVKIDKIYCKYRREKPSNHPIWNCFEHIQDFETKYYKSRKLKLEEL